MSRSIWKEFQGQGGVESGRAMGELCLYQARNAQASPLVLDDLHDRFPGGSGTGGTPGVESPVPENGI